MTSEAKTPNWFWMCLGAFIILFCVYSIFAWAHADEINRGGSFGDAFGAFNAFISGLACLGVVYAILQQHKSLQLQAQQTQMQSDELRLQREELKATRQEMERSTLAQQQTSNALSGELALVRIRTELDVLLILLKQEYSHVDSVHLNLIGGRGCESLNMIDLKRYLSTFEEKTKSGTADGNVKCLVSNLQQVLQKRKRIEFLHEELIKGRV